MKLLQLLNEIEVPNLMSYRIEVDGKILLVAFKDEGEMNWDEAFEACEKLGDGWRLPTIEELKAMHNQLHRKRKGNFIQDTWYWSSSEYDFSDAWGVDFWDGNDSMDDKSGYGQVHPVRDI